MEKNFKRTLVTCALPYANGPLHIGHLAGVYVPADIYVRYLRMRGEKVLFVCGSDEHGVPITIKAKKEGCSPQDIVDKYHKIIKDSFAGLGIDFDIYSRTSSATHHRYSAEFFRKLYDDGKFIVKESEQYYDPEAKTFLADRYIVGTCPKCGNEAAYGDQCEKCGSTLSPEELINPHSAISGSEPVKKKTKHWYLPLDQYEGWLKEWILEEHKEWKPNVYGQCKSWLDGGLQPRAVSRDLDWGVPVPVEGAEGKVLYVWFDAPIGYISNTIELLPKTWEKWWKSQDTRMIHFIGKDNIVFHCIVFPSMLKAYGDFILPDNVPANEFLNLEGEKLSTSRNHAVWLHEYLQDFPGQQDVLRYVLCANMPETKDNDFTWKDFQAHNNSELVAILGNFVNRAVVLSHKYFGGLVPEDASPAPIDTETLAQIPAIRKSIEDSLDNFKFREALKGAMEIARLGNKYISDTEPWKTAKTDMARTASILNVSLQICANLAIVFEPFLPESCRKLRKMLNVNINNYGVHTNDDNFDTVPQEHPEESGIVLSWNLLGNRNLLPAGHRLAEAELLFSKIDDEAIQKQLDKLEEAKKANALAAKAAAGTASKAAPQKDSCTFEEFGKMDIRTATVLEAERVPKTDKLLKLTIDTGIDKRTIVSGIAEYYTPEQMLGKQICILANLLPRKIKGIESQGMILMARQPDGKMRFITPEETLDNGAEIG
ncbi:MAG: methionine--tRNA ligase [Bacteroidetes bacterium]|uniref:Methionine--tRNA ligase n=1 Tax=Candidatus Merdivivens pullicola TaxID=2840872 RepID=A0A9D9IIT9_9BACT|nr:methionine--tRNA ligase [Candidatus Merdivivens pullicola]